MVVFGPGVVCSVSLAELGSIIGGPPLETSQSVWRYGPKKHHAWTATESRWWYQRAATITATDSLADTFYFGCTKILVLLSQLIHMIWGFEVKGVLISSVFYIPINWLVCGLNSLLQCSILARWMKFRYMKNSWMKNLNWKKVARSMKNRWLFFSACFLIFSDGGVFDLLRQFCDHLFVSFRLELLILKIIILR